ncbi:sugar ABC transporter substrate-binding protein [Agromyces salentinus]|uniref:Maltodextrin ABC transporter substrate-binding protein MdxE n=1 Tax=Agromyces salentinus TaxID=269421 RepID=A0ABN2N1J0_9MICO|nr:sugar ABC transporter substrate-binding protein [Agromyces salentinus]
MRNHRTLAAMGIALSATVMLAACTSGSEAGGGDGPVEITMIGADLPEVFAPLIDAFEEENPEITVTYQNVPFDQYNNVLQQRIGGKDAGVDVYLADAGAIGSLATKGFLTDLSEYRDQVEESSLPATVEGNMFDGKLWALPMWTSLQYLYYNKSLLDAAGIAHPSIESDDRATWEDLTTDAKSAQAAGAEWGLLFDQTDRYYQLQALPESKGGGSGATGDDLLTADVTNDGWIESMKWYGSLFEDGVAPRGVETDQMVQLFAGGKAAYFVGGPWSLTPILEADSKVDYGIAPNPMFDGGTPAMPTGSWNIAISPATDALEASKKFIEFASLDAEGNAISAQEVIIPPTNVDSFSDYITKMDGQDAPNTDGMGELTLSELEDSAVNRPNTPGFTQMQDVLGRAFSDIRNGGDVEETLQKAQDELQGLWDRL